MSNPMSAAKVRNRAASDSWRSPHSGCVSYIRWYMSSKRPCWAAASTATAAFSAFAWPGMGK